LRYTPLNDDDQFNEVPDTTGKNSSKGEQKRRLIYVKIFQSTYAKLLSPEMNSQYVKFLF